MVDMIIGKLHQDTYPQNGAITRRVNKQCKKTNVVLEKTRKKEGEEGERKRNKRAMTQSDAPMFD
jgi:hypothetical protein